MIDLIMNNALPKKNRLSIRLPEYNYTQSGYYFITICTYKRQCW
jgi:putative transposase